jgi:hypothetical protein
VIIMIGARSAVDCGNKKCHVRLITAGLLAAVMIVFSLPATGQQSGKVVVRVHTQSGESIRGARIRVEHATDLIAESVTDSHGAAEFTGLGPDSYRILAASPAHQSSSETVVLSANQGSIEIDFTLVAKPERTESVEVRATAGPEIEQSSSPATGLRREDVKSLPSKPATVVDTLPLVPGIARTPDGEIQIGGTGEHRSALVVNATDVTDPATGRFGTTVPVDIVESIDVFQTPFLAQYGRFTSGVVSVETRRGGEKWHFELNDPFPDFRIRSWRLRGLRDASPRINFSGPLIANKLYFSEGLEYNIAKTPVRTLPFPNNESKTESVNSFSQLDYIVSDKHFATGTFHLTPRHTNFVDPQFFSPQPTTPSFRGFDRAWTLIDHKAASGWLIDSTLGFQAFDARVGSQGDAGMVLTPTGNLGNYYSTQERDSGRIEWLENVTRSITRGGSTHNLRFGSTVARTSNSGQLWERAIDILDTAGHRLKRIDFTSGTPYRKADVEQGLFAQDHWMIAPNVAMDAGMRLEYQGITGTLRVAPRIGVAWTPLRNQRTVIRGGFGIFYDRVPLSVYSFSHYPEQIVTNYGLDGQIQGEPRRYLNITETDLGKRFALIDSASKAGNFAPFSKTWNISIEHPLSQILRLRANYTHSDSGGVMLLSPRVVQGNDALVLSGGGKSSYRQLELTAKLAWKNGQEMLFSYVRSRSQGDLNEFNQFLGNFPSALVRPNQFSNLSGDLPNRFIAWGLLSLPLKMQLAPIFEYRNGFPYAPVDAARNYVGLPNSEKFRFPNFLSVDARILKDIKVNPKYTLRFSVSGFNLTNHFNALDVHSNIADPQSGVFFGNYKRRYRADFDVIF